MNTRVVTRKTPAAAWQALHLSVGVGLVLASPLSLAGPLMVATLEPVQGSSKTVVELHTTNCVNALRSREIEAATVDCERAVLAARAARLAATPFERAYGGGARSIELAVAYSNRAVLHHLAGNAAAARADIATAAEFTPGADFVTTNTAVIGKPGAVTAAR